MPLIFKRCTPSTTNDLEAPSESLRALVLQEFRYCLRPKSKSLCMANLEVKMWESQRLLLACKKLHMVWQPRAYSGSMKMFKITVRWFQWCRAVGSICIAFKMWVKSVNIWAIQNLKRIRNRRINHPSL